jgi:hypothetical protein
MLVALLQDSSLARIFYGFGPQPTFISLTLSRSGWAALFLNVALAYPIKQPTNQPSHKQHSHMK